MKQNKILKNWKKRYPYIKKNEKRFKIMEIITFTTVCMF